MQSSSQIITTNKLTPKAVFTDRMPSLHPMTNVKALKVKYHIPWTCLPNSPAPLEKVLENTIISVQRISDTITYQFTFDGRFSRVLVINVVCDDRMLAEELDMMRQNSGDNGQHSFFQTVIVIG